MFEFRETAVCRSALFVLAIILVDEEVSVLKSELLKVEKPARYMGGEMGTKKKSGLISVLFWPFPMSTKSG